MKVAQKSNDTLDDLLMGEFRSIFLMLVDIAQNFHKCPYSNITMGQAIGDFAKQLENGLDEASKSVATPQLRSSLKNAKEAIGGLSEFANDLYCEEASKSAKTNCSTLVGFMTEIADRIADVARDAGLNRTVLDYEECGLSRPRARFHNSTTVHG